MSEDDAVHYRLLLGQKEHHLELYPSHRFCSPGAIIEEHRTGNGDDKKRFLDDLRIRRMRDRQCHYQGRVRNHPDISALSTCYGLVSKHLYQKFISICFILFILEINIHRN